MFAHRRHSNACPRHKGQSAECFEIFGHRRQPLSYLQFLRIWLQPLVKIRFLKRAHYFMEMQRRDFMETQRAARSARENVAQANTRSPV